MFLFITVKGRVLMFVDAVWCDSVHVDQIKSSRCFQNGLTNVCRSDTGVYHSVAV